MECNGANPLQHVSYLNGTSVQVEVAASQFVRFEVCSGSVFGHVCILHVEFFYVAITMAMV